MDENTLLAWYKQALHEDLSHIGDVSTLAAIHPEKMGTAHLILKQKGILAGLRHLKFIFDLPHMQLSVHVNEGIPLDSGTIVATLQGRIHDLLSRERLVLNILQRMSGIATYTNTLKQRIHGTGATLLDTRKTTPLFRYFEKEAVQIGGGENHRFGLFDMIMLKDNHIAAAGGIVPAIQAAQKWVIANGNTLKIEVETQNLNEVEQALSCQGVHRIMFDNFSPQDVRSAVALVGRRTETEASGGIHSGNIREYAETGVQFISVGALTHSAPALDLSLKITQNPT
jgi:nicotinate-nucleotide pyrophosphorylase (carboxylating)